jgi:ribosomal protein L14E/L6E/L27E
METIQKNLFPVKSAENKTSMVEVPDPTKVQPPQEIKKSEIQLFHEKVNAKRKKLHLKAKSFEELAALYKKLKKRYEKANAKREELRLLLFDIRNEGIYRKHPHTTLINPFPTFFEP